MIGKYIRFWLILGATVWPAITIYALRLPYSPNNLFQIAYGDLNFYETIFWYLTTPIQGAIIFFIGGAFITAILISTAWSALLKPLLQHLGLWKTT